MMGLGILWALFAPLLLAIPFAALVMLLRRRRIPERWQMARGSERRARWTIAAAFTLVLVLAGWLPGYLAFRDLCDELGEATQHAKAQAAGFFLDDPTANSFGMRYLHEEGFEWIEAHSIHKRGGFVRYQRTAEGIKTIEIEQPSAIHIVRTVHSRAGPHTSVTSTVVAERAGGKELARAGSARFDGGWSMIVLGAWGTSSCPNPASAHGAEQFKRYYHLARETLR